MMRDGKRQRGTKIRRGRSKKSFALLYLRHQRETHKIHGRVHRFFNFFLFGLLLLSVAISSMTPPKLAPDHDGICGLEMGDVDKELIPLVVSTGRPPAPSKADMQFGHHITKSISKPCCALLLISMALNLYLVLSLVVAPRRGSTSIVQHAVRTGGNVQQDVVYGHVHVAKTAGTDINGELALHFERVCGHKGYSYDAYQFNERVNASGNSSVYAPKDVISQLCKNDYNRGRVPKGLMSEIGFEDCDYISLEGSWKTWKIFKELPSLELHVPCRDPLSHLMSQCNFREIRFNCTTDDLPYEIESCIVADKRFSRDLEKEKNINLKCFNPIPVEPYLEYMSERLQRKRIDSSVYVHRDTNMPRNNKYLECIWNEPDVATQVRGIMLQNYDL
jgi:hypothetical protein